MDVGIPFKGFSQSNHFNKLKYKVMRIKQAIGIDISKLTFDVRIHSNQMFHQFENTNKGFKKLITWVKSNNSFSKDETIFIFEHTGIYSYLLSVFLTKQKQVFALVSGLEIKRSLGIFRGKDDKIDATKIAQYGYRLRDEIKPYTMPCEDIIKLKRLLSLRERLVKQRAGYKSSLKEFSRILTLKNDKVLLETQQKIISYLTKQIKLIEQNIDSIIDNNDALKNVFKLVISVKCVGRQTALFIIAYTEAFAKFKTWRQFASYCGTAPFPNSSGTSLRGNTRVSHLANKKVKSLLDLCAKVAIQYSPEMKAFYKKRVTEGKNKMSTINIIRNKLLSRIFAVVDRETPYVDFMKYAA
jgi:transposase